MRKSNCVSLLVVLAVGAATLCGCGGSGVPALHPASGKAVYTDDTPLPKGASVVFDPPAGSGYMVAGEVQDDGSFVLSTTDHQGNTKPGAPAGEYRVYVTAPTPDGGGDDEGGGIEPPPVTSDKFGRPDTSGITQEIKAGDNKNIEIRVDKPGPAGGREGE